MIAAAKISARVPGETRRVAAPPPMAMLAELTHRCPLACPYCSNPQELVRANEELSTSEWIETFRQAAALGVLHLLCPAESQPHGAIW